MHPHTWFLAAGCAAASAWSQSAPTVSSTPAISSGDRPTVVVTGNPLRDPDPVQPTSVLGGTDLLLRRASSLGDTLDGLPGTSATRFGPSASRPILRGQDGDRIRLLSNAGASLDASALSFDHAVPIDPLVVERVEVLRGPAALLYGGSAVGGVINSIDNRIPTAALAGTGGVLELRAGGAADERAGSALVEGGGAGWAWHADGFVRRTGALRVPTFDVMTPEGIERRDRVANSDSHGEGGALGASRVWTDGHAGVSLDSFRSRYGVVADEAVRIRMQRDRLALGGEWRALPGWVSTLRAQASASDYRHVEIEGDGAIGTTFTHRGGDLRLEAVHRVLALPAGRLQGVWGLQAEDARFDARGEEAFVPPTRTRQWALFALESWTLSGGLELSAGWRGESVRVRSQGDGDTAASGAGAVGPAAEDQAARFGPPQQRRFTPHATSLGAAWSPAPGWRLAGHWSRSERAPTSYELFADGVHVATAAYERGDPQQVPERGRHRELSLAWSRDGAQLRLALFGSRFARYIALLPTGEAPFVDENDGTALPVYAFQGVPARLSGVEAEARWPLRRGEPRIDLGLRADALRAERSDTGEPLPRIPPRRVTLSLDAAHGPWGATLELRHAARQDRVPAQDSPTPGYTLWNLALHRSVGSPNATVLWFVRATNLGHRLAYQASTVATLRDRVPLDGRSLSVGMRAGF